MTSNQVLVKMDATSLIEAKLQEVHNLVLAGKYNATEQQKIFLSKYHDID
jgi:hypothetical protein